MACVLKAGVAFDSAWRARIVFIDGLQARVEYTGAATAVFFDGARILEMTPLMLMEPKK